MYICSVCSAPAFKWQGRCVVCQNWNVLVEAEEASPQKTSVKSEGVAKKPVRLAEVDIIKSEKIISSISEWDTVLGGGIMPGSLIIVTGDPGVGKSTLMLQVCNAIAARGKKVLYFSSEESLEQLHNKIATLGLANTAVWFSDDGNAADILATLKAERPVLAIVDSLQNCRLSSGGAQNFSLTTAIKETAHQLMVTAKSENIAIIMTGHITKEGILAGPKLLEHLVDAVFYLQNDTDGQKKILTSVKNRFGPIDEIGFFELGEKGFVEVCNVNQALLEEASRKDTLGSVLFLSFHGSRCLLSEFQALCVKNHTNLPQRVISGVDAKRVLIIAALLEKYLKLDFSNQDIFFKIRGGIKIAENCSDLAIALAILSSLLKTPVPAKTIAVGEINLGGRISAPQNLEKLVKNSKKLGVAKIITGTNSKDNLTSESVLQLRHVYELLQVFDNLPQKY